MWRYNEQLSRYELFQGDKFLGSARETGIGSQMEVYRKRDGHSETVFDLGAARQVIEYTTQVFEYRRK